MAEENNRIFPWIKKEPNDDYDDDNEMFKFLAVMVMGCNSITPVPSSTTSPNGRGSATPSKDIAASTSPRVSQSLTRMVEGKHHQVC